MKKLILTVSGIFLFVLIGLSQKSHLQLIYDFKGNDFEYGVIAMAGANDSLYIISNTPDGRGRFFSLDENGNGFNLIWEFDNVRKAPNSLIAYGNEIYGTTRFSPNGGGTLFRYSLVNHSFKFIKDFHDKNAQEVQIKHINGNLLWLTSQVSFEDNGSICTINPDGSDFKKIYNDTDMEKGQNPVDFIIYRNKIYIACYNGGGILHAVGDGTYESSGCFIRINTDGTGYEKLIIGGDEHGGSQPQSLIIDQNKITGLFAHTRIKKKQYGGQFFQCNLDGSSFQSLGVLGGRCLTRMSSTDSLIYGISSYQIFGVNPIDGEVRIFKNLLNNPDFGYDMTANPAILNGNVYISTLQGGPNRGGTILKWTNEAPQLDSMYTKSGSISSEIILSDLFTDPEGDSLSYDFEYNTDDINLSETNGILTILPLKSGDTEVKITANDGWLGHNSIIYTLGTLTSVLDKEKTLTNLRVYPNPVTREIHIENNNYKNLSVSVIDMQGRVVVKQHLNNKNAVIPIDAVPGVYNVLITDRIGQVLLNKKIIKQ